MKLENSDAVIIVEKSDLDNSANFKALLMAVQNDTVRAVRASSLFWERPQDFRDFIDALKKANNLTALDVTRDDIGPAGAAHIAELQNLTALRVAGNAIGDAGAAHIATIHNLIALDIGFNDIGAAGPAHIAKLTNLTALNMRGNDIGPTGAAHIARLKNLTALDIDYNHVGNAAKALLRQALRIETLQESHFAIEPHFSNFPDITATAENPTAAATPNAAQAGESLSASHNDGVWTKKLPRGRPGLSSDLPG